MSPRSSANKPGGPYRKPRADLYTILLAIALAAILLGILCLYLEMHAYDFQFKGGPTVLLDLWRGADNPVRLALGAPYEYLPPASAAG